MINTVIALPYEAARLPLRLLDQRVAGKLPETSGPRVTFDRTLGKVDQLAGSVLRNRDIAERGTARLDRVEKATTAARLEQQASTLRDKAQTVAESGIKQATQKRKAARQRVDEGFQEAETVEQRGKRKAAEDAASVASRKKAAAAQRAETRVNAAEERKKRVETAAESKKRISQKRAEVELDEARENAHEAAADRADAERLSELTEAKKQARKKS